MSRINTYHTLQLNAFSEACSGDDKDERSLKQWAGGIVAPGRDRARLCLHCRPRHCGQASLSPPLRTSVHMRSLGSENASFPPPPKVPPIR